VKTNTDSGQHMSDEHIVSQMRTVISAGYETISATVAVCSHSLLCFTCELTRSWQWILYELAINPALQQRLREEVSIPGDPSFDDLNRKFPLLDATLQETLRMHPAIIENHHVVSAQQWYFPQTQDVNSALLLGCRNHQSSAFDTSSRTL